MADPTGDGRPAVNWWRDADGSWQPPERHPGYAALQEEAQSSPLPIAPPMRFTARAIVEIVLGLAVTIAFGWVTWFLFQPHPGALFVATPIAKFVLGIGPTCLGIGLIVHGITADV